jgi:hypothetical protein
MIQLSLVGFQAKTNALKRTERSQLSKKQIQELIPTVKPSDMVIAKVAFNALVEFILIYEIQYLREKISSFIHNFTF